MLHLLGLCPWRTGNLSSQLLQTSCRLLVLCMLQSLTLGYCSDQFWCTIGAAAATQLVSRDTFPRLLATDLPLTCKLLVPRLWPLTCKLLVPQVTKLEKDIEGLRSQIIEKDDALVEAVRETAAGDEDAANDVKRLRGEKKVLQAQLECKTRQLKVSLCALIS